MKELLQLVLGVSWLVSLVDSMRGFVRAIINAFKNYKYGRMMTMIVGALFSACLHVAGIYVLYLWIANLI